MPEDPAIQRSEAHLLPARARRPRAGPQPVPLVEGGDLLRGGSFDEGLQRKGGSLSGDRPGGREMRQKLDDAPQMAHAPKLARRSHVLS